MKMTTVVQSTPIPEAIFGCSEALDAYLQDVRARRERRRYLRDEIARVEAAIARVRSERIAAVAEADEEIARELDLVLERFEAALCVITAEHARLVGQSPRATAGGIAAPVANEAAPSELSDTVPTAAETADQPAPAVAAARIDAPPSELAPDTCAPATPVPPTLGMRDADTPLIGETPGPVAGAVQRRVMKVDPALEAALLAEIERIDAEWQELDRRGLRANGNGLDRAACFRLRALACELAGIHDRAGDLANGWVLRERAIDARDRIHLARHYAGEGAPAMPFDEQAWDSPDARVTAEEWRDLADRYSRLAEAQTAWVWYRQSAELLPYEPRLALLNRVAAAQQRVFRFLLAHNNTDRLQSELYGELRDAASVTGFLTALDSHTADDELERLANDLTDALARARRDVEELTLSRERQARKEAAIEAVVAWGRKHGFCAKGAAADAQAGDTLAALLDACLEAGVPPTNKDVRGALMEAAPSLLAGQPRYAKFLQAVLDERQRLHLDAAPQAAEEDDVEADTFVEEERQRAATLATGKRLLILGGVPRRRTCDLLEDALACDADWLQSKKSDKAAKFRTEIGKSDILLVLKNFAGHDMSEKGKEWIRQRDGHFLLLPAGYGVNQIVHQLSEYVLKEDRRSS